jgi:hypothetical protein
MVVDTCQVKAEEASKLEWTWTEQALQTLSLWERSGSLEKLPKVEVEVELGGQLLVTTSIPLMIRLSALHDWHPSWPVIAQQPPPDWFEPLRPWAHHPLAVVLVSFPPISSAVAVHPHPSSLDRQFQLRSCDRPPLPIGLP